MSHSDSNPFRRRESQQPQPANSPTSGRHKNAPLTGRSGSSTADREVILTQLQEHSVVPAPRRPLLAAAELGKAHSGRRAQRFLPGVRTRAEADPEIRTKIGAAGEAEESYNPG
ncbi:uncharacterized protein ACO6RY_00367 [Pungitius sinensis]